jgi:hypothetical protein
LANLGATMATQKTYKNPTAGTPLISTISSGCKTPIIEIKFSNLIKPFYYPNSPTIPRYSITCVFDPISAKEFLKGIQTIEKNEQVDSIIKNDTIKQDGELVTSGLVLIKFQNKDKIPVFIQSKSGEIEPIELEDELARGEDVIVTFDILRYTKKNTMKTEHGLSFKPIQITLIAKE